MSIRLLSSVSKLKCGDCSPTDGPSSIISAPMGATRSYKIPICLARANSENHAGNYQPQDYQTENSGSVVIYCSQTRKVSDQLTAQYISP